MRISTYVGPGVTIEPQQLNRYNNHKYIAEKKYDGIWCLIETDTNGKVSKLSTRTGVSINHPLIGTNINIPNSKFVGELEWSTDIAVQVVAKRGYSKAYVFDVIQLMGHDVTSLPLEKRHELVTLSCNKMKTRFIIRAGYCKGSFEKFFKDVINEPLVEGIILKKLGTKYVSGSSSGKTDNWVRVKIQRTVDLYVVGIGLTNSREPNLIVGKWDGNKMVPVQSMSVPKGYKTNELIDCIIECVYDRVHNSGRYRHLRFKRIRTDKSKEMTG